MIKSTLENKKISILKISILSNDCKETETEKENDEIEPINWLLNAITACENEL